MIRGVNWERSYLLTPLVLKPCIFRRSRPIQAQMEEIRATILPPKGRRTPHPAANLHGQLQHAGPAILGCVVRACPGAGVRGQPVGGRRGPRALLASLSALGMVDLQTIEEVKLDQDPPLLHVSLITRPRASETVFTLAGPRLIPRLGVATASSPDT